MPETKVAPNQSPAVQESLDSGLNVGAGVSVESINPFLGDPSVVVGLDLGRIRIARTAPGTELDSGPDRAEIGSSYRPFPNGGMAYSSEPEAGTPFGTEQRAVASMVTGRNGLRFGSSAPLEDNEPAKDAGPSVERPLVLA